MRLSCWINICVSVWNWAPVTLSGLGDSVGRAELKRSLTAGLDGFSSFLLFLLPCKKSTEWQIPEGFGASLPPRDAVV